MVRPVIATVDQSTYAWNCIDYVHHEIHQGKNWIWQYSNNNFDSTNAVEFVLVTPNTDVEQHFNWAVEFTGPITLTFTEGVTHTPVSATAGTNRNRRLTANVSGMTVDQVTSSFSTGGTALMTAYLGKSGAASGRNVAGVRDNVEWVLNKNVKYSLKVTSEENDIRLFVLLGWYEHTRKE